MGMLLIPTRSMGEYGIEESGVIHSVITDARKFVVLVGPHHPEINGFCWVMLACSPNSTPADNSTAEPQGAESAELAAGAHRHLPLWSLDALLLLPAVLLVEVHRAAGALQHHAHVGSRLAYFFLKDKFESSPSFTSWQTQLTSSAASGRCNCFVLTPFSLYFKK
jgi:hypothetical protein